MFLIVITTSKIPKNSAVKTFSVNVQISTYREIEKIWACKKVANAKIEKKLYQFQTGNYLTE
jgi:hypothetical protein